MLNCCIQKRIKRENIHPLSEDSDDQNLPTKCTLLLLLFYLLLLFFYYTGRVCFIMNYNNYLFRIRFKNSNSNLIYAVVIFGISNN